MSTNLMNTIFCNLAALAVANIFYWYRAYRSSQYQHNQILRERIAYMLWVAASRVS